VKVNFYATFRPIVGGKTVQVDSVEGSTLQQLLQIIVARFPPLGAELFDADGHLHGHVHVFVNGRDSVYLADQLETQVKAEDVINIFPPVGGG
jgi:molybdopterin synthase sulfur carrier subunit